MTSEYCSLPRSQKPLGIYRSLMALSRCTGCLLPSIKPASHPFQLQSRQHNLLYKIFLEPLCSITTASRDFNVFKLVIPPKHDHSFQEKPTSTFELRIETANLYHLISFDCITVLFLFCFPCFSATIEKKRVLHERLCSCNIVDWDQNVMNTPNSQILVSNLIA